MKTNNVLNLTDLLNRGINKSCVIFTHETFDTCDIFAIIPSLDQALHYFKSLSLDDIHSLGWNIYGIRCYLSDCDGILRKLF